MLFNREARKSRLILLIEQLDAILYAIEDLEELSFKTPAPAKDASADDILDYQSGLRQFVEHVRARELSLIAYVSQARHMSDRLKNLNSGVKSYARLFSAGTQAFADQLERLGQSMESDFDGNDQVMNFLHARSIITPDCLSVDQLKTVSLGENYRISGLVAMTDLAALCTAFLDLLESHELLDQKPGPHIPADKNPVENAAQAPKPGASLIERLNELPDAQEQIASA